VRECIDAGDDARGRTVTVAAVVLAAGSGSRFGGVPPKLRVELRGKPLVRWVVDAALAAGLDEVFVVSGAIEIADLLPAGVKLHHNESWQQGIATSLACAVTLADAAGADAIVVGLGDQPFVPPDAWRAVAEADATPIAVATYDGRRRNPVRLAREVWASLPSTGDEGARKLMADRPDLVAEIPCPGDPADIDTEEDLHRWS
jgi:CTP:molybdopterin cytidylyltransferase MocA